MTKKPARKKPTRKPARKSGEGNAPLPKTTGKLEYMEGVDLGGDDED
jgi:hypothetical protein